MVLEVETDKHYIGIGLLLEIVESAYDNAEKSKKE